MIRLICQDESYIYNAYHIMKAFYPAAEVQSSADPEQEALLCVTMEDGQQIITGNPAEGLTKKQAEHALYLKFSELTGRKLPWGQLTGVRPTKLAMKKLEEGFSVEEFCRWIAEEDGVSGEKARLSWSIAAKEHSLIQGLPRKKDGKPWNLYINIPVCPSICSYCSFASGALSEYKDRLDDYLAALETELDDAALRCSGRPLTAIYIGGGTPTSLNEAQLERLLSAVCSRFPAADAAEFTVEAGRADTITREKLKIMRAHGVSRISINPQTMQQKTLDLVGRHHTSEDVREAFAMARGEGFSNINMDLIAGLPGEGVREMADTLAQIESLCPDSLTVHALAIKRKASMHDDDRQMEETYAGIAGSRGEEITRMTELAAESAAQMGMEPYYLYRQKNIAGNFENVGYARPGCEGLYNIIIMEELEDIIACGAGASTKYVLDHPVQAPGRKKGKMTTLLRHENVSDIENYIKRVEEMVDRKKSMC